MTVQTGVLLIFPLLLAMDIYAMVVGRRGKTQFHKIIFFISSAAVLVFIVCLFSAIDLFTQVWVARPGNASEVFYVASGAVFLMLSAANFLIFLRRKCSRSG